MAKEKKITLNTDQKVQQIVELLEQGFMRAEIVSKITVEFGCSATTADRCIREAKKIIFDRSQKKEKAMQNRIDSNVAKMVDKAMLSDIELESILCTIASGNMSIEQMIDGSAVLRNVTPNEITQAIKVLFTKRGSNAPIKQANTTTDGKDVSQIIIQPIMSLKMTPNEPE
jgi:hypothetical protein